MGAHHREAPGAANEGAGMATRDQLGDGWTVVLRCQPPCGAEGGPEGAETHVFELICGDCGDHPGLGYREVLPGPQRRGPQAVAADVDGS